MSVEPNELVNEMWTRWQGHLINGVFPLGRYLGCSDHSAVFLTKSAALPGELAIKLVPTNRTLAETQLPRWKRAGNLTHPNLLRLLDCGGCQLDGLPYLYAVMEYADQTLAQLLLSRALTADEAHELLLPTLDALGFLHGRNLLHGQLKPANILVVGDQLKLASDTIRRVGEGRMSTVAPTVYDAPEAREGSPSTAADIWALGVSLFEALTRRAPSGAAEPTDGVLLPADFSPAYRKVVGRCLSVDPQSRPTVTELVAWTQHRSGVSAPAVTTASTPPASSEPTASRPVAASSPPVPVPAKAAAPARSSPASLTRQPWLAVALGVIVSLVLIWMAVRLFRAHPTPAPTATAAPAPGEPSSPPAGVPADIAANARPTDSSLASTRPTRSEAAMSPAALHEVIPEMSPTARRTIRGHIKVWVRVMVDQKGSVFGAVADRTGPSRYFQQLAIEAARQWTFAPVDAPAQRLMQIRFDFAHEGATARVVMLK